LAEAGVAYQGELGMWASPNDSVGGDIMREGLAELGTDRPDVRARALSALAHGLVFTAGGGALPEAEKAVAAAREAGDDQALCHALLVRSWAVRGVLPVGDRLAAADDGIATARSVSDRWHEISTEYCRANALLNLGDLDAAEAAFMATDFRGALEDWAIADFRAARAIAEGRFREAAVLIDVAHGLGAAIGETNDGLHAIQRWNVDRLTGNVEAARAWHVICETTLVGLVFPTSALAALSAGEDEEARGHLEKWMRDVNPLVPEVMRYSGIPYVAELALRLGEFDGLTEWSDYAECFPGELLGADGGFIGACDASRGCFAAVLGDLDRAVELLETGHAMHTRLALHQLVVESGSQLGTVLLRRDEPGDRERGIELLDATAEVARAIGMTPAERRARALLG
jgi:hypothetical protein